MKRFFAFLAYLGIPLAGVACGGEQEAIAPSDGQASYSGNGKAAAACKSDIVCRTENEEIRIDEIMAGASSKREEVLDEMSRVWSDDREPVYWGTGKAVPPKDLPLLWRESCWYCACDERGNVCWLSKWWWTTKDNKLFIPVSSAWNGMPVYDIFVYKLNDAYDEFVPHGIIRMRGLRELGDDGFGEDAIIYKDGLMIFSPERYEPIELNIDELSLDRMKEIRFVKKDDDQD